MIRLTAMAFNGERCDPSIDEATFCKAHDSTDQVKASKPCDKLADVCGSQVRTLHIFVMRNHNGAGKICVWLGGANVPLAKSFMLVKIEYASPYKRRVTHRPIHIFQILVDSRPPGKVCLDAPSLHRTVFIWPIVKSIERLIADFFKLVVGQWQNSEPGGFLLWFGDYRIL